MREKLLEYLKNVGPLSGEDALAIQVAEREVRVVRARFLESMYELDRCIGQLQSQGRTNTNIPDVLYRQKQLQDRELKVAELEGDAAYWEYTRLCRDAQELCQAVDELLKPRIETDI